MRHIFAAVFLFDPVEHQLAPVIIKINVDIWHRDPIGIQEPFKQKVILHRVNIGNTNWTKTNIDASIYTFDGLIFIQDGENKVPLSIIDDSNTGIVLNISRDLSTLTVKTVNGEEWLANEAYSLRPAASLAVVASETVTIPASGTNSLYRIPSGTMTFSVPVNGRVIAYDLSGNQVYDSFTQGVDFGLVPKSGFIRFVGLPGVQFTVSVSP